MKQVTLACDHCGKDLSDAGPMPTYYLALSSPAMGSTSNIRYGVCVEPYTRPADFCGPACLLAWARTKFEAPIPSEAK